MKLVFVTDNGFSEKDGVYYFSSPNYTHVNHLKKYFDEFVFIARNDNYDKSYFKIDVASPVYLFGKFSVPKMIKKLGEVIEDADAVICYGINGYFAYKVAKRKNKIIITYNGGDAYDFLISRGTMKGRVVAPIVRYLEKEKFLNADYAHYCDSFLVDKYPTKGEVLVCSGVSIEINEKNLENRISRIKNKTNKKFVVGLTGHTRNNLKGIGTAIKAIGDLDENFEFQVVGRGDHDQYDELAESLGIENRVTFLGTLKAGDEIFNWLDSIDIYIQPSLSEGLPRATIEAMSRGCPIISSNAGGLTHLIEDEFRINYGDYMALSKKIKHFANDLNLMESQAIVNFRKSREFAPEIRDKKYDDFYGKIVGRDSNC
ncbi:glycosyltransferase family 4 protein [Paenibacillus sp. 2RAB27]|uniref:glycosyltransferase family 4 protein n=1 Tax=Paenibacillus sp. 2RAB27 TaxID=3232991 RepID=UPI003F98D59D